MHPHTFGRGPIARSQIRLALADHLRQVRVPAGHGIADAVGEAPRDEVVRMDLDKTYEVLRMRHRQRPEQQSGDHTEDQRIRADADGQQQRRRGGKH